MRRQRRLPAAPHQEATISTLIDPRGAGKPDAPRSQGVIDDRAHGVSRQDPGRQAAQKTNAHQLNKNLLLSARAAVDTSPSSRSTPTTSSAATARRSAISTRTRSSPGQPRPAEAEARRMLIEPSPPTPSDLVTDAPSRGLLARHLERWLAHHRD